MEDSLEKKTCPFRFVSGPKKGTICGKPVDVGNYCKCHRLELIGETPVDCSDSDEEELQKRPVGDYRDPAEDMYPSDDEAETKRAETKRAEIVTKPGKDLAEQFLVAAESILFAFFEISDRAALQRRIPSRMIYLIYNAPNEAYDLWIKHSSLSVFTCAFFLTRMKQRLDYYMTTQGKNLIMKKAGVEENIKEAVIAYRNVYDTHIEKVQSIIEFFRILQRLRIAEDTNVALCIPSAAEDESDLTGTSGIEDLPGDGYSENAEEFRNEYPKLDFFAKKLCIYERTFSRLTGGKKFPQFLDKYTMEPILALRTVEAPLVPMDTTTTTTTTAAVPAPPKPRSRRRDDEFEGLDKRFKTMNVA